MHAHLFNRLAKNSLLGFLAFFPMVSHAQGVVQQSNSPNMALMFLLFVVISFVLSRAWTGVMTATAAMVEHGVLHDPEARKKHLPSILNIVTALFGTAALFVLALNSGGGIAPFNRPDGVFWATLIFGGFGALWAVAYMWYPRISQKYLFAFIVGTVLSFALIGIKAAIFSGQGDDPFLMSIAVVTIMIAWKFLFGPWKPQVKATVLGVFLFWIGIHILFNEPPTERIARLMATGIAIIPAAIWCWLFWGYHHQRKSLVLLMFFSGMVSTAPILFYDSLVRHNIELQFFLFTIVPESFIGSSNAFVAGNMIGSGGLKMRLTATFVSFLLVGLIEEMSKFWVLRKSGEAEFTSIDDVMQLAIIVAIGFAFAENVLNPTYFVSFIKQYLIIPEQKDWSGFFGNILGRSVLTNMVHIVSTGVMGYFYGFALFARPYLREAHEKGRSLPVLTFVQHIAKVPEKIIFTREMLYIGISIAIILHGMFNFIVTVPDILPGNPRTLGDIFASREGSILHMVAILMLPSLFYVVGGFWLLSTLFYRKECMKERGHIVRMDTFVQQSTAV